MADEKMRILNMLSEGKITPEEAEKLLAAIDTPMAPEKSSASFFDSMENKNLYVQVEPKEGKESEKVSIKVPFALLKAGLNIAGLIPQEAQDKINTSMNEKGINFNLNDMDPKNIQEIMAALEEFSVDIDTEESTVQVYCR
ncbi:MAG: hypothetical protein PQJ61_07145 [Spirochaetales bacterium]|uniref:YvlB/LiaX N-terminal domain-containing protein n=1 Tax=Candidatus Thalassospirochaeta sargassi TaxID=3119039 RepID=A0AAJ1IE69_9SPIO|nr:hypothetical protein [Spirochaetales bacterium]